MMAVFGYSSCLLRVLVAVSKLGMSWSSNMTKLDMFHGGNTTLTLPIVVAIGMGPIGLLVPLSIGSGDDMCPGIIDKLNKLWVHDKLHV